MKFVDQTPDIVKYDFSSIITEQDQTVAMSDIKRIIDEGNYFKNSPKYQTQFNVFNLQSDTWLKIRFSFIFACFMYAGREVPIKGIQSWSFMTNNEIEEDREQLWHTHNHGPDTKVLSGIYYLHVPEDADYDSSGTEFAPNHFSNPERVFVKPSPFSWIIYPGKTWHRPMPPQSKNYRFVIAADMGF